MMHPIELAAYCAVFAVTAAFLLELADWLADVRDRREDARLMERQRLADFRAELDRMEPDR